MNQKPVYAGSFDPITNGHLDIIKRAIERWSYCYVLCAINPDKTYMFQPDQKTKLITKAAREYGLDPNLVIPDHTRGMVADWCKNNVGERAFLIRGIRDASETAYELEIARFNKKRTGIDTLFLPADEQLAKLSSSAFKKAIEVYVTNPAEIQQTMLPTLVKYYSTPSVVSAVIKKVKP